MARVKTWIWKPTPTKLWKPLRKEVCTVLCEHHTHLSEKVTKNTDYAYKSIDEQITQCNGMPALPSNICGLFGTPCNFAVNSNSCISSIQWLGSRSLEESQKIYGQTPFQNPGYNPVKYSRMRQNKCSNFFNSYRFHLVCYTKLSGSRSTIRMISIATGKL